MVEKIQKEVDREDTHSAEVRAVSALGDGGGDTKCATGSRAGTDLGGSESTSDSVG